MARIDLSRHKFIQMPPTTLNLGLGPHVHKVSKNCQHCLKKRRTLNKSKTQIKLIQPCNLDSQIVDQGYLLREVIIIKYKEV